MNLFIKLLLNLIRHRLDVLLTFVLEYHELIYITQSIYSLMQFLTFVHVNHQRLHDKKVQIHDI